MFQWFSANRGGGGVQNQIIILFNCKSQNKKNIKHESGSADLDALRKTLRNTRRMIGSEINVRVKGKVKGSGRGRPLYTNNGFTPPDAGPVTLAC